MEKFKAQSMQNRNVRGVLRVLILNHGNCAPFAQLGSTTVTSVGSRQLTGEPGSTMKASLEVDAPTPPYTKNQSRIQQFGFANTNCGGCPMSFF